MSDVNYLTRPVINKVNKLVMAFRQFGELNRDHNGSLALTINSPVLYI